MGFDSRDVQEYLDSKDSKTSLFLGMGGSWISGKISDLSKFINLEGLEVRDSLITNTNLDFLNTLPNKEKLKKINFSGNRIKEVDFADLFTKFPNLEKINLQNNPLSAKNLDKLSNEQFARLVNEIEEQNIKIDPLNSLPSSTIAKDLLEYVQELIANNSNQSLAYLLQEFILENQKKPNDNVDDETPLLISGLIVLGVFVLLIVCWLRQRRKKNSYWVEG